jgi:hypothetical protein
MSYIFNIKNDITVTTPLRNWIEYAWYWSRYTGQLNAVVFCLLITVKFVYVFLSLQSHWKLVGKGPKRIRDMLKNAPRRSVGEPLCHGAKQGLNMFTYKPFFLFLTMHITGRNLFIDINVAAQTV